MSVTSLTLVSRSFFFFFLLNFFSYIFRDCVLEKLCVWSEQLQSAAAGK